MVRIKQEVVDMKPLVKARVADEPEKENKLVEAQLFEENSFNSLHSYKLEIDCSPLTSRQPNNNIEEVEKIFKHKFGGRKRCDFDVKWNFKEGITKVNVKTALKHKKALKSYLNKLKPSSLKCMLTKYTEMSQLLDQDQDQDHESKFKSMY